MRIVRDSEKIHRALFKQTECPRCETVVEFEVMEDFRRAAVNDYVTYVCPRCGTHQRFTKPVRLNPSWKNVQPCTTKTIPWNTVVNDFPSSSLSNQMENAETQDEYFGK